jgi:hypothetical protein
MTVPKPVRLGGFLLGAVLMAAWSQTRVATPQMVPLETSI